MIQKSSGSPKKGLNRDTVPFELSNEEYSFALNANFHDEHGNGPNIIQNEPSNVKCTGFKTGFKVIGHKYDLLTERTYFFLYNPTTNASEIGYVQSISQLNDVAAVENHCQCNISVVLERPLEDLNQAGFATYVTMIEDYCAATTTYTGKLNFSLDYPIFEKNIIIKHSKLGNRMFFTDNRNPQRFIELDNLQQYTQDINPCDGTIVNTCLNVDKMRIFPLTEKPCLTPKVIQNGGNLRAGVYEVLIASCTMEGSELSDYNAMTNPVPVHDKNNNILDQTNLDYATSQAIAINVYHPESNSKFFKIAVIYRSGLDGAVKTFINGIYPTTTTKVTIHTDKDKETIPLQNLLLRKVTYTKAKVLADSNGYLFQGGLTAHPEKNLQPIANLLGGFVEWGTVQANEDLYDDGVHVANYTGYMRDEVVPAGIVFHAKGGYTYPLTTLIPRPATTAELATQTSNKDTLSVLAYNPDCSGNVRDKVWQYKNTATVIGDCTVPASGSSIETEQREQTYDCYILNEDQSLKAIATIASSSVEFDSNQDLVSYINSNLEAIKTSTGTNGADIRAILNDTSNTETCTPEIGHNCSKTGTLVSSDIVAISADSETVVHTDKTFSEYSRPTPPTTCNSLTSDGTNPILDTDFISAYMNSGEKVYKRNSIFTNTNCNVAQTISELTDPQVENQVFLQYQGDNISAGNLKTIITTSATSTVGAYNFSGNIHTNALWYKIDFAGKDKVIVEITPVTCNTADDNTNNAVRLSFLRSCIDTATVGAYSKVITDMSAYNDTNKFITLNATDFGGVDGTAYVAIDSAIRTRTVGSNTIFTLSPPCGCFSVYKRKVETNSQVTYTNLKFGKKQKYSYICSFEILKLNGCDPVPHKRGKFSYWQSDEKYPCNLELYDSSHLTVRETDIPTSIRTDFQNYYANSSTPVTGGKYNLDPTKTNFVDKNIRHYKFPDSSVIPFMSVQDNMPGSFKPSVIYPIGFRISNEVINAFLDIAVNNGLLTLQERINITGYEIFRGDRRTDKSIIAKGLIYDTYRYSENDKTTIYPNYPLNKLGDDEMNNTVHPYGSAGNTIFTFHSPETHFEQPTLPREMSVEGYMFGQSGTFYDQVLDHSTYSILGSKGYAIATTLAIAEVAFDIATQVTDWLVLGSTGGLSAPVGIAAAVVGGVAFGIQAVLKTGELRFKWIETIRNIGKPENFAYYQVSVGHYNWFKPNTVTGEKVRGLSVSTRLKEGRWNIADETNASNFNVNNLKRETSVLLSLGKDSHILNYPTDYINYDYSKRVSYDGIGRSNQIEGNTAAPYVSLKQYSPSQYGDISSVDWLSTGFCGNLSDNSDCNIIFGGDTYITRFALKRKLPFFTNNAVALPPLLPFAYSDLFNINPTNKSNRFFIDYLSNNSQDDYTIANFVFPSNRSYYNLDSGGYNIKSIYVKPPNKFYLFSYGIPYFLVESEINCNFRYAKREKHENFYPNVGDVIDWTQEKNVSIDLPNEYFYNTIYSQEHTKAPYRMLPNNYSKKEYDKLSDLKNAVIWSKQDVSNLGVSDPWLVYRPLDTANLLGEYGDMVSIDPLESEQVLVRYENGFKIFNAVDVLKDRIDPQTLKLGTAGIFTGRVFDKNKTDLGFGGTQHVGMVSNEFGRFWVDAVRGQVFNLGPNGQQFDTITEGLEKWFKENLPFKIKQSFPNIKIGVLDNHYKGLGIALGWDARLKRFFITKKDYAVIKSGLNYNENDGFYKIGSCPEGYTNVNGVCTKITTTPKIPGGVEKPTIKADSLAYGFNYPALYSAFNSNGSANADSGSPTGYTYETLASPFWVGSGVIANRLVNKLAKWVTGGSTFVWYGATSALRIITAKTYYIVLTADNQFRLSLNGTVLITSDTTVMSPQFGYSSSDDTITFKRVHIYPIELPVGCHRIKIEGLNQGSLAMFGAAVLDNTAQELRDAISYSDLRFVYSTETETKFYEDSLSYVCPEGFTDPNPSNYCGTCEKIETVSTKIPVPLSNTEYFKECSWTAAYSPLKQAWISYYSFKPNYYVNYNNYFQTGVNFSQDGTEIGLWSHLSFLSSYQVFYGKRYPFTLEFPIMSKLSLSRLDFIEYWMDIRKYYNRHDYASVQNIAMDQAVVYNLQNNSGLLNLVPQIKNNVQQTIQYPKYNSNSIDILQTEMQGKWSFNHIFNLVKNSNSGLPIWLHDCAQIDKTINSSLLDYRSSYKDRLRGDYFLVRLSNTKESRYKMMLRYISDSREFYDM